MQQPKYEGHPNRTGQRDGDVLAEIATWYLSSRMPAALAWLWERGSSGDDLASLPSGSPGDAIATRICAYFDAVGVFSRQGMVPAALLNEWLGIVPVWDRLHGYVLAQRSRTDDPALWMDFETLALNQKRMIGEYAT